MLPAEIRSVLREYTLMTIHTIPLPVARIKLPRAPPTLLSPDLIVQFAFCLVNICSLSGLSRGK